MAAPWGGSAWCRILLLLMTSCFRRLQKRARPAPRRQWDIFRKMVRVWVLLRRPTRCDPFLAVELGRMTTAASSVGRADQCHLLYDHHLRFASETYVKSMTTYTPSITHMATLATWRRSSSGQCCGVSVPLVKRNLSMSVVLLLACILVLAI
jgi:hypothetical protein